MYVWGAAQRGIPTQINVVGTVMFLLALVLVLVGEFGSRRRAQAAEPVTRAPAVGSPVPGRRRARRCSGWTIPAAPAPSPAAGRGRDRPTWSSSAAATPGCGPRCVAKERRPELDVVAARGGASAAGEACGRNGGFAAASPDPRVRQRPGALARRAGRSCDRLGAGEPRRRIGDDRATATGSTATGSAPGASTWRPRPHQVAELAEAAAAMQGGGHDVRLLDGPQVRAEVDSPTYLAGLLDPHGTAMVEPARLAVGAAAGLPGPRGADPRADPGHRAATTTAWPWRCVTARGRGAREPGGPGDERLPPAAAAAAADDRPGLRPRAGHGAAVRGTAGLDRLARAVRASATRANLFHYYRLTRDDRILWGGYDAVYHFGSRIAPALEQNDRTHALLAAHFFETFPQLEGLRFTHRVGRRDRHLHPVLRVLRHGLRRTGGLRPRLHRARRRGHPVRRRRHARPAGRRRHRAHPAADGARAPAPVPAGARPGSRDQPDPAGPWSAPTTGRADGTCGCAPWTGSAWASTPEPRGHHRTLPTPRPQRSDQALSRTARRICSISSKCCWSQMSGGASWITGSPRSSARQ